MSKRIALLCLLLTVWSAAALAAHHHSSKTEGRTCTFCLVSYTSAPAKVADIPKPAGTRVSEFWRQSQSDPHPFTAFVLSVRPPPAG